MTLILALAIQDPLDEARRLMEESEKLLNDLRAGKSIPVQEEIIKKLEKMIEEARAAQPTPTSSNGTRRSEPEPRRADRPYTAERRSEPGSKFESRPGTRGWGHLDARTREAILHASRDLDKFPPEYREMMRAYFETLASEGK